VGTRYSLVHVSCFMSVTYRLEKAVDNKLPKEWIKPRGLSKDNIIGDKEQEVSTRRKLAFFQHVEFVSEIEPKNFNDALCDSNWVVAM